MHRWQLQSRSRDENAAPCIAISRLPGSGGVAVGRRVAEWLDYGLFGREIVEEVAREMGVDHWVVAGLDERVRTSIERYVSDAFRSQRVTEGEYLRQLARTIATIGRRGSAVLVGRGAPFILSPEHALRVLLVASRPRRIARYAEVRSLSPDRAEAALAQEEERRREFARVQFGVDYTDPLLYDLVANTGTLSFEAAAGVIIDALRRRFSA